MKRNRSILKNKGFQSLAASILCILLGLLIGYVVLLIINPAGAGAAITTIVKNFFYFPSAAPSSGRPPTSSTRSWRWPTAARCCARASTSAR